LGSWAAKGKLGQEMREQDIGQLVDVIIEKSPRLSQGHGAIGSQSQQKPPPIATTTASLVALR